MPAGIYTTFKMTLPLQPNRFRWSDPEVRAADLTSLARTPILVKEIYQGRPDRWLDSRHGSECLSPREVLGHFIVLDTFGWLTRMRLILDSAEPQTFAPFDISSGHAISYEKRVEDLVAEFALLRANKVEELSELPLTDADLGKLGIHPKFGLVTLDQLISTWVAHDLYHLGQIFKSFAAPFQPSIGPWQEFLNLPQFN